MSLIHKFLIDYISILFKSATVLFVGIEIGGVAYKCSIPHLSIPAIQCHSNKIKCKSWGKKRPPLLKVYIIMILFLYSSVTGCLVMVGMLS